MSRPAQTTTLAGGIKFRLDRRYADLKQVGRGSYGVVVSALDRATKNKVAIKKITPMAAHASDATRVLREARLMRLLGVHPNIISMYDASVHEREDALYIVMELLDSDLHRIIQSPQALTEAHHRYFMWQLLRGVRWLHAHQVIHRDLKPGNLLVTRQCSLRITDFGLARVQAGHQGVESVNELADEPMTQHVVTRWYRPPELMLVPDGRYTGAVDLWSVGCILAELLGRKPLFPGKNFVHQLTLIFDAIGAPPQAAVAHVKNRQALKFLESTANKRQIAWGSKYPDASPETVDLLGSLLQFEPSKRLTADEAIEAPYFASMGASDADEPALVDDFEFDFEDQGLSKLQLKKLILTEVGSFKKGARRAVRAEAAVKDTAAAAAARKKAAQEAADADAEREAADRRAAAAERVKEALAEKEAAARRREAAAKREAREAAAEKEAAAARRAKREKEAAEAARRAPARPTATAARAASDNFDALMRTHGLEDRDRTRPSTTAASSRGAAPERDAHRPVSHQAARTKTRQDIADGSALRAASAAAEAAVVAAADAQRATRAAERERALAAQRKRYADAAAAASSGGGGAAAPGGTTRGDQPAAAAPLPVAPPAAANDEGHVRRAKESVLGVRGSGGGGGAALPRAAAAPPRAQTAAQLYGGSSRASLHGEGRAAASAAARPASASRGREGPSAAAARYASDRSERAERAARPLPPPPAERAEAAAAPAAARAETAYGAHRAHHRNPLQARGADASAANLPGPPPAPAKRPVTVAQSPKFSKMSWERESERQKEGKRRRAAAAAGQAGGGGGNRVPRYMQKTAAAGGRERAASAGAGRRY